MAEGIVDLLSIFCYESFSNDCMYLCCRDILKARDEICSEYERIKDIVSTLGCLKIESGNTPRGVRDDFRQPNSYSRYEEPTRDPDVWPPPTPSERR